MKEYTHSSLICMTSGFMKSQQLAATRADTAQAKVLSKHMSDTIKGITQGGKISTGIENMKLIIIMLGR